MFNMDDTIAAVSTPALPAGSAGRSIIRLSGPETFKILDHWIQTDHPIQKNRIIPCQIQVDPDFSVDAQIYAFCEPHSYTGQDLAELHLDACAPVVEAVLANLYQHARPAAPGEFTQRAFLNGKIDLTQAEAVAEIVSSANATQLAAAERLLHGRFSDTIADIRNRMVDLMGHLEAALDFTEEDIEFISKDNALSEINQLRSALTDLLEGSVRCERMIDLDSVGLAGVPNAGKSSLLNTLLGQHRSIVSGTEATTRDVLTGVLSLNQLDCVLFDCAGLLTEEKQTTLIDQLSHQSSLAALNSAAVVLFCVDLSKSDIAIDLQMHARMNAASIIYVATKADALTDSLIPEKVQQLNNAFDAEFLLTSTQSRQGIDTLKDHIQGRLLKLRSGDAEHEDRLTINQRHRQRLQDAVKTLADSADEITLDSAEIAVMLLRQAYELLGTLERENISETVLDRIFSRFCIGK